MRAKPTTSTRASLALPADQEAAANYIAAMARDLSAIAQQHGMTTLGYLLDIARLEAERSA